MTDDSAIRAHFEALGAAGPDEEPRLLAVAEEWARTRHDAAGHLAWYYLNTGNAARARELYESLLAASPGDEEVQRRCADALAATGATARAASIYRQLLTRGTYASLDEVCQAARELGAASIWRQVGPGLVAACLRWAVGHPAAGFRFLVELVRLGRLAGLREIPVHTLVEYLRFHGETAHRWARSDCDLCGERRRQTLTINARHRIVACAVCGLERADRIPPGGFDVACGVYETERYAAGLLGRYWMRDDWRESRIRSLHAVLGEDILRHPAGRCVFEIGAGRGDMLQLFREWGFAVDGMEAGARFVEAARETFALTLRPWTLRDLHRLPSGSQDIVLCFHVIEHVDRPSVLMAEVRRILKPEGTLVLETPVTPLRTAPPAVRKDEAHGYAVLEHTWFFTEETLRALHERQGFRVLCSHATDLRSGHRHLTIASTPA